MTNLSKAYSSYFSAIEASHGKSVGLFGDTFQRKGPPRPLSDKNISLCVIVDTIPSLSDFILGCLFAVFYLGF